MYEEGSCEYVCSRVRLCICLFVCDSVYAGVCVCKSLSIEASDVVNVTGAWF